MALLLAPIDVGPERAHLATNFRLLGPVHLAILGAVVILAAILAFVQRRLGPGCRWLRIGMGSILLVETGFWYAYNASLGQLRFPDHLPLELCDATLYLTIAALLTLRPVAFDLAYCWALAGTSMALLTPDLWERFPSLSTLQFFFAHGLVVAAVLYLAWSGLARPRRGSAMRAFVALNLFAAFDGGFDWIFKTNYMYLAAKPENASLLSLLGPWPLYILASEGVALILFLLLCFPFRRRARGPTL
jgi:hypothetical integral membrane protein (TIGR02206 family)